ncbi:MAG: right-handed parallel beta-helix repeat-containing protein [Gammaproteobacteria bacterium]
MSSIHRHYFGALILVAAFLIAGCSTGGEDNSATELPGNEQPGGPQAEPDPEPTPDPTPEPDPEPTPDPTPEPEPQPGVDTDGDGVMDIDDAFPNDPVRVAALPPEFDAGITYSRELFVAPTGNDDTGDGSADLPYQTVAMAARHATPGTRINLQPGTYRTANYYISNLQGTANEPIAIVANGDVIFDAEQATQVMHFTDPRYVVLEGFTVQNTSAHGINIDDGSSYDTPAEHVIVRNVTFRNIGSGGNNDCLKMSGVDRFLVLDSEFDNCNQGEAIDMVGCHEGVVKGNFFHNIPRNAINTKGGSSDILIQGNRFTDIASRAINAGGSTGEAYFRPINANYEGKRIRMLANIFERVGFDGGASVAFVGCDLCVFANNTIVEPQTYIARILQESQGDRFVPSRNGYFINNIVVFNESDIRTYVNIGAGTAPETFTFGNNLWYALDNPGYSGPNISSPIPAETGSVIQQDPQFDLVNGDYSINLNNPAAGNGRDVPGTVTTDFAGQPFTSPLDIGAFAAQ